MALKLSVTAFVVITLSIFAIILGVIYLVHLATLSEEITQTDIAGTHIQEEINQNSRINLAIYPSNSQEGTVFAITASTWPHDQTQDLHLLMQGEGQEIPIVLFDDGNHYDGQARDGTYGALFDSQNVPLGEYVLKNAQTELGEFTISEPGCEPLIGSTATEKINFLVLPSGYTDLAQFKEDTTNLFLSNNALFEIEPFKSKINEFSFSYLWSEKQVQCEVGCNGIENMVCCDDREVANQAAQCHNDGIIVVINSDQGCGTASFYTKVCARSELARFIVAHELGHAFGGLADEYVYADNFEDYNLPDSYVLQFPNCASAGCEKWKDITSDCVPGCTSPNLYRSSENSIMRYISYHEFNDVSKNQLNKIIDKHLEYEANIQRKNLQWKSYTGSVKYDHGQVSLSPVAVLPVQSGAYVTEGYFTVKIFDKNKQLLHESHMPLPLLEQPAFEISDNPMINQELELPLITPFFPNADTLEITDPENNVLAITSLAVFSDFCGDNLCSASENAVSCTKDCASATDNFCSSARCDPNCPTQENCATTKRNYTAPIVIILGALLIILVVIIVSRKINVA